MVLTAAAAALLIGLILPDQTRVIRALDKGEDDGRYSVPDRVARRLGMLTGVFNPLWAVVVIQAEAPVAFAAQLLNGGRRDKQRNSWMRAGKQALLLDQT